MSSRNACLIGACGLAIAITCPPEARAKTSPAKWCARAANRITKTKRLRPRAVAGRLDRTFEHSPACVDAPSAAWALLHKDWAHVLPTATRRHSRAEVLAELGRYRAHVDLAQAIAQFRKAPVRVRAVLAVAQLHDAMAQYLDEVGTGPDTVFVIKDKNALYHSRAVDLREHLKLEAEKVYQVVIRMLRDASSKNEILIEAKQRLATLRQRYAARVPPPPPPKPEDDGTQ